MLDLLALGHAHGLKHMHEALRAEKAQQIILQRQIKSGLTWIALTARTAAQLIINAAGFVTLRTNDL